MPIEIKSDLIIYNGYNGEFVFSGNIGKYIVGINGFNIVFSDGDVHCIKNITVQLNVLGVEGNRLTVEPKILLEDNTGHRMGNKALVYVSVIAWTDDSEETVHTASNQNMPFTMDCSERTVYAENVLSGFKISCADKDLEVWHMEVATSIDQNGSQCINSGEARFTDHGGNKSNDFLVKGSCFAETDEYTGMIIRRFNNSPNGHEFMNVPDEKYRQYAAFINSFSITAKEPDIRCSGLEVHAWPLILPVHPIDCRINIDVAYRDGNQKMSYAEKGTWISGFFIAIEQK